MKTRRNNSENKKKKSVDIFKRSVEEWDAKVDQISQKVGLKCEEIEPMRKKNLEEQSRRCNILLVEISKINHN